MKYRIIAVGLVILLLLSAAGCTNNPYTKPIKAPSQTESSGIGTSSEDAEAPRETEAPGTDEQTDAESGDSGSGDPEETGSQEHSEEASETEGPEDTEEPESSEEPESAEGLPESSGEFSRALAKKNQEYRSEDAEISEIRINPQPEKRWTVMVYMTGSNLESSLGAASADIAEMEDSGIDFSESNVILYTGGSTRWQSEIPCDRNCILDLSREGEERLAAGTEKNADMGAKETLASFVNFCTGYYPAEHYALILWDHGGGPLWGYGSDELFQGDGLLLSEMDLAMQSTEFSGIRNLDFVGFDACLMGCIENMMIWTQFADYYVGSEELEPGDGWDYHFLKLLNETDDAREITGEIVDSFRDYYEGKRSEVYNPDLTLSAVDLSEVRTLMLAVSDAASRMSGMLGQGGYAGLTEVRYASKSFGQVGSREQGTGYDYDLVDIGSFFSGLREEYGEELTDPVLQALSGAVLHSYTNMEQASGISLYYPQWNHQQYYDMREFYEELWKNTAYRDYLRGVARIWQNTQRKDWTIRPERTEDDEYTVTLTEEQREEMISAHYSILLSEHPGQYRLMLGDCEILPDDQGVLHLPKDPALLAVRSGEDFELWPAVQTENTKKRRIYQTRNTTLCASGVYFYSRYNIDRDPVTVVLQEDVKTGEISVRTVNSVSQDFTVDGRETVNVGDYDAICYDYTDLVPAWLRDGGLMQISSWNSGDYKGKISLNLRDSFGFETVQSSELPGNLYYVVSITDARGGEYLTEPFPIEPKRPYETVVEETAAGQLSIAVYEDHAELLSYEGTDESLVIPASIGGVPLTVIRPRAFFKRVNMDYVGVGEHYPLKSVTIPDTVEEISHAAFYMCADLTEVKLPENLRMIGTQAFAVCTGLTELSLPEGLKSIGPYAFSDCWKLRRADLPGSLAEIGKGAFACCYELSEITLPEANEAYTVYEGGLYTEDFRTMIAYPAGREGSGTLHPDTDRIGPDCFSGSRLSALSLPEGLTEIGNYAFYEAERLETPILPESLRSIGYNAFSSAMMEYTEEEIHESMQEIRIGKNLTSVRRGAFSGIIPRTFTVNPENPRFSERDGALLTKNGDSLQEFAVRAFRTLVVPEGVKDFDCTILTEIGQYDVWSNKTTTDIYFPDSLIRLTGILLYQNNMVFHCSSGSAAEKAANEHGIRKSSDTDPVTGTMRIETENGSMEFYLTETHAGLQLVTGTDEELKIPREVAGLPVTVIGSGEYGLYGKWLDFDAPERGVSRKVVLPDTVEVLADQAFSEMKITEISLPDSVREIGESAFGQTDKILTELPKNLERLGFRALGGIFADTEELLIPKSLRDIAPGAFLGVNTGAFRLEDEASDLFRIQNGMLLSADGKTILAGVSPEDTVEIPEGIEEIGAWAFANQTFGKLILPSSLAVIRENAFTSNYGLFEVEFSEGLREIESGNFTSGNLETVNLPESCETIGANAFSNQNRLESVSMHAVTVGSRAFSSCRSLQEVDFGENLKELQEEAFMESAPEQFELPESLLKIGSRVFGLQYVGVGEEELDSRKERTLRIPKNLQSIGENCFTAFRVTEFQCDPEGEGAFSSPGGLLTDRAERVLYACPAGMEGLLQVPDSIFEIRTSAFSWCRGLSGIVIPETTEVLRPFAFTDLPYREPEEKLMLYGKKDSPAGRWALENDWPFTEKE